MDKETAIKAIKALFNIYNTVQITHAYKGIDMLDDAIYELYNIIPNASEEDLIKFIENNIK